MAWTFDSHQSGQQKAGAEHSGGSRISYGGHCGSGRVFTELTGYLGDANGDYRRVKPSPIAPTSPWQHPKLSLCSMKKASTGNENCGLSQF